MFAITTNTVYAFTDKFKKVGKRVQKQRKGEVEKIKDRIKDIARDEEKRAKDIFKQHQDIFKPDTKKKGRSAKSTSIDLFEK
jgi:cell fate regulator YaaT (PSP1 superfamily)|tara:strand:- start:782 stop:1027 length:246 start_codon:yes stop_codon:yes gene_type:complete